MEKTSVKDTPLLNRINFDCSFFRELKSLKHLKKEISRFISRRAGFREKCQRNSVLVKKKKKRGKTERECQQRNAKELKTNN